MVVIVQRHAPAALHSGKRPGYHCTGGWLCHRACLDGCRKSRPNWESIPDRPVRSTEWEYPSFYGPCLKTSSMCVCVCVCVCVYVYIYIYIYFFFLCHCDPTRVMASSFLKFLDHTQRCTTFGRTPLDQ